MRKLAEQQALERFVSFCCLGRCGGRSWVHNSVTMQLTIGWVGVFPTPNGNPIDLWRYQDLAGRSARIYVPLEAQLQLSFHVKTQYWGMKNNQQKHWGSGWAKKVRRFSWLSPNLTARYEQTLLDFKSPSTHSYPLKACCSPLRSS